MVGDAATGDDALAWSDIRYVVGRANRVVLDGTSGVARASRLLGILGPSGSGKTTLLNVLAGRLKTDGTATNTATTTTMRKRRARRGVATGRVAYAGDASGRGGRGATPLSYVEQDPKFFSNLTVRETLTLDAALQGGDAADVDAIIRRLGLVACADTYVGGDTGGKAVRGISGGERRRLAIAAETLCLRNARRRRDADAGAGAGGGHEARTSSASSSSPQRGGVILADEPTTGLDAHQADKIVQKLRETAVEEAAAVVCVLHQPRSAIFDTLDDLLLLASGGRVAYCGPAKDALRHFEEIGHACPRYHNPAEFLIDLVAVDADGGVEAERADVERVDAIAEAWKATAAAKRHATAAAALLRASDKATATATATGIEPGARGTREKDAGARRRPPGAFGQFKLLVGRAFKQCRREAWVNGVRLVASAALALAFGGCNYDVGLGGKSVKRRAAVMMQACINTSMLAVCRSLNGFPRERATVSREMSRVSGGYKPGPYFFSKLLVETPIDMIFPVVFGGVMGPMVGLRAGGKKMFLTTLALQTASASCLGLSVGALAPSAEMALAIGPCIMVLSIMLGDESGAFAEVPESLRGVSNFSLIKWAFRGCLCSEFEGLVFDPLDKRGEEKKKKNANGAAGGIAKRAARNAMEGVCPRTGEEVLEGLGLPTSGGAARAAKAQARPIHCFPYDRVGVVNADP